MAPEAGGQYADADPEYALDGADDIDLEVLDIELTEPSKMPKDQGDIGTTEPGVDAV